MLAKNAQTPYDPGPYVKAPLTPVAPDVASSVPQVGSRLTTHAPACGATAAVRAGPSGPFRQLVGGSRGGGERA